MTNDPIKEEAEQQPTDLCARAVYQISYFINLVYFYPAFSLMETQINLQI